MTLVEHHRRLRNRFILWVILGFLLGLLAGIAHAANPLSYPVIFLSSPRYGNTVLAKLPDVFTTMQLEPGTHLMLLDPGSGAPEVLVDAGTQGAVLDPVVSFDAQYVYYSFCTDVVARNQQRRNLPRADCNLWKIHIATRVKMQLTFGEYTPIAGAPTTKAALGHGIFNVGTAPLAGNKLAFVSNRNGAIPNKTFTDENYKLYVLDETTGIQEEVGFLNLGSALHPAPLIDGRIMWTSYEAHGLRDRRLWGLWASFPDGRGWGPLMSAIGAKENAVHFQAQQGNGDIITDFYYNKNNNGFGTLNSFTFYPLGSITAFPRFGSPTARQNPFLYQGYVNNMPWKDYYAFSPVGLTARTPFASERDEMSAIVNGQYVGKVTHPAAAPGNDVLLSYTPGPANHHFGVAQPTYDSGIYLLPGGNAAQLPSALTLIYQTPERNEWFPQAVVTWQEKYGAPAPPELPWLPASSHPMLLPGTPYGLVGTSSFYKRNTDPGQGNLPGKLDDFNRADQANSNWGWQGAMAGLWSNSEMHSVRIVVQEPLPDVFPTGLEPYVGHIGQEKLRILGEIPLRKPGAPLDPDGNPDTSFLSRIPADTPFTFQLLDSRGMALTNSQTWHQVRPGENRHDCGGCHAHNQVGTNFDNTVAGQPGYIPDDLTQQPARSIEYVRDIRPKLQACLACHNATAAGNLRFDIVSNDPNGLPNDYNRLANDPNAQWGTKPPAGTPQQWIGWNSSRYVRKLQSRRSLLGWKVVGQRTDGLTNASRNDDVDMGTGCPASTLLTDQEKRDILAWIDIGAPIGTRYLDDTVKPTITLHDTGEELLLGLADAASGINMGTLYVTRNGLPQQATSLGAGRLSLPRMPGHWVATVQDNAGNMQTRELVVP
jgi:hypothetical protein